MSRLVNDSHVSTRPFAETSSALDAYDQYVLGRPKIAGIDISIVPDSNALVTRVLSGGAEITLGGRLSVDQTAQISCVRSCGSTGKT